MDNTTPTVAITNKTVLCTIGVYTELNYNLINHYCAVIYINHYT